MIERGILGMLNDFSFMKERVEMATYEYKCENTACPFIKKQKGKKAERKPFEDFEVRSSIRMDDPMECPHCKGNMVRFISGGAHKTGSFVKIKDTKYWLKGDGTRRVVKKRRTRVLGTEIGRIRLNKLHIDELHKMKD